MNPPAYTAPMGRPRNPDRPVPTGRDLVPGFAAMIRAAREARGWSLAKLADEAGVSLATLHKLEMETRAPSLRVASQVVAALGLLVMLHDPAKPIGPTPGQ